ncbi:PREDICTED: uncharacterized protein LOC109191910 isoform X2 [Ipomoea nil]|uniref:uncharacterized protein LOC109191910 isoform X2 n=1 Tax=Ipomoea nil TaxID=35883 RepID=UPI000901B874|nr:PREDICTED: uncharacterized protein LOC109191910 isoform X2 [Ipomoea nil]
MAEELDDCEYWLPPQFLTEDDLLMDFKKAASKGNGGNKGMGLGRDFGAPQELGYGGFGAFLSSTSDLSSPVESLTETESDEDDYITGLTRKMAQSTLHDSVYDHENTKAWRLSGSPQSTLCGVLGGGCGCSPNYPSRVSSPPTPEMARNADDGAWDLLYAAAGEVARMKLMEEAAAALYQSKNGVWAPPRRPSPVTVPSHKTSTPQNPQLSTYQQLQLAQFQRLKQLQMVKNQQGGSIGPYQAVNQSRIAKNGGGGVGFRPPSAWPTLQQSQQQQLPGSGMRAVFLGNPAGGGGAKRECSGTGVFIPRRTGNPSESRKKPGCSTVLLPDRVVQALNLNVADSHHPPQGLQPRFNANAAAFTHDYDGAGLRNHRSNAAVLAQPKKHNPPQGMAKHHHELRLPQEWTY